MSFLQSERATIGDKKTNTNSLIVDIWGRIMANSKQQGSSRQWRNDSVVILLAP